MNHPLTQSTYPSTIATSIRSRWSEQAYPKTLLPSDSLLEALVDVVYQASLLREEGDPVRCRVVFSEPKVFADATSDGNHPLHALRFDTPQAYSPHNLRKLAAAAGFYRAMLAVEICESGSLQIWGMIVTGTQWVNDVRGSQSNGTPLPPNLVIQILGPGHLSAASGYAALLETTGGQLLTDGFDPFRSQWLPQRFAPIRESLLAELSETNATSTGTRMCDSFIRDIAQSIVRRVLRLVKNEGHGGMLVYLPDQTRETSIPDEWFRFRVRFQRDDSTLRFRRLMLRLIKRATEVGQALGLAVVTWEDYQEMRDSELAEVDAAMVELSHLVADLMSVDGAVVLDQSFRLIGFGAEILGTRHVQRIHRALDIEAAESIDEPADTAGTRHRSAYRLVNGIADAIAVVVSQDGDVRFVANHQGKLAYWPYLP